MKKIQVFISFLLVTGITLFYWGCASSDTNPDYDYGMAADNALAENSYEDAGDWSDMSMGLDFPKSTLIDTVYKGTCVVATLDTTLTPRKLTIDFGTTNCKCDDNKYRRGQIIVTYTGKYFRKGTVITHTFNNYYVNDNKILGTRTITNMGRNEANHLYWDIVVAGQIEKANNGGTITWNCERTREWIAGEGQTHANWEFAITGSAYGSRSGGLTYTSKITEQLIRKASCPWIVSGLLVVQPLGYPAIGLNYGNGDCDGNIFATINGKTITILLK